MPVQDRTVNQLVGIDSIPISFKEPFVLLSTGTWCISLNPFNQAALTVDELTNDVLYIQYEGKQVKRQGYFQVMLMNSKQNGLPNISELIYSCLGMWKTMKK